MKLYRVKSDCFWTPVLFDRHGADPGEAAAGGADPRERAERHQQGVKTFLVILLLARSLVLLLICTSSSLHLSSFTTR